MRQALIEAQKAERRDEVPVGAVIVCGDKVIARGYNLRESKQDATLHAEMIAIKRACRKLRSWRLVGCTMYVTLEPCAMCAGASVNARLDRVVFGASDEKAARGILNEIYTDMRLSHRIETLGGVLKEECSGVLKRYFADKRTKSQKAKRPHGGAHSQ